MPLSPKTYLWRVWLHQSALQLGRAILADAWKGLIADLGLRVALLSASASLERSDGLNRLHVVGSRSSTS